MYKVFYLRVDSEYWFVLSKSRKINKKPCGEVGKIISNRRSGRKEGCVCVCVIFLKKFMNICLIKETKQLDSGGIYL